MEELRTPCTVCTVKRDLIDGQLICPICHVVEPVTAAPPEAGARIVPPSETVAPEGGESP
jgi:hypothetical protein